MVSDTKTLSDLRLDFKVAVFSTSNMSHSQTV